MNYRGFLGSCRAACFNLNYQGFLDSCRRVQLRIFEDVLQVQGNVLLGGVKEFRHLQLGKPDGLLLRPQLDLAAPVFGGVQNQVVHGAGVETS